MRPQRVLANPVCNEGVGPSPIPTSFDFGPTESDPHLRANGRLRDHPFQPTYYFIFRLDTDDALHLLASFEYQKSRNAAKPENDWRSQDSHPHSPLPLVHARPSHWPAPSRTGATIRHGPHHGAHRSSKTGSGERSTSAGNVASVTATRLLPAPGNAVWQRPRRAGLLV